MAGSLGKREAQLAASNGRSPISEFWAFRGAFSFQLCPTSIGKGTKQIKTKQVVYTFVSTVEIPVSTPRNVALLDAFVGFSVYTLVSIFVSTSMGEHMGCDYGIEKSQIPENWKRNRQKIGKNWGKIGEK